MELKNKWNKNASVLKSKNNYMVQSFTSTIIPKNDNEWRVWYSIYNIEKEDYGFGYTDGELHNDFKRTEMRISKSECSSGLNVIGVPDHWNLIQPVYIPLINGKERIYFWAHGKEGICRYLYAESEDGINFHVKDIHHPCLYHPNDRAVTSNTLKTRSLTIYCHDGRKDRPANEPEAPADMLCNDATNVYLLPDGTFELYTAEVIPVDKIHRCYTSHDPSAGLLRVIQRRTSTDGINWSSGQRIIEPDNDDPYDLQFYYLAVTHTSRGRIGTLGYYRADKGTMDIEFCFSKDGIHWTRPCRGAGIQKSRGIESIYAPHSMIEKDGQYFLFHTAYNFTHHGVLSEYADNGKVSEIAVSTIDSRILSDFVFTI